MTMTDLFTEVFLNRVEWLSVRA